MKSKLDKILTFVDKKYPGKPVMVRYEDKLKALIVEVHELTSDEAYDFKCTECGGDMKTEYYRRETRSYMKCSQCGRTRF